MSLVLDCSATLAWVYGDERSRAIVAVFEAVAKRAPWSPPFGGWRSPTCWKWASDANALTPTLGTPISAAAIDAAAIPAHTVARQTAGRSRPGFAAGARKVRAPRGQGGGQHPPGATPGIAPQRADRRVGI